jgi:hypothetical protein
VIKKSIIVTVIAFIGYSLFISFIAPQRSASQHQWQDNIIKAQKFIYNDRDSIDALIIGSSLSCRLIMDSLPQVYNLSFGGQSIYDGLDILSHKSNLPKHVFIEMNFALRGESKEFTSSLYSPFLYYPKKVFPALREDKQPLALMGSLLNNKVVSVFFLKLKSLFNLTAKKSSTDNTVKRDVFSTMLQLQVDDYSKAPDRGYVQYCFARLKQSLSALEERGVKIIFFEIPVNSTLVDLPKPVAIRSVFYREFPATKYPYIPFAFDVNYKTTDGLHLTREEALSYTIYLRSKMKNYLQ